jgi:hypothetical protein
LAKGLQFFDSLYIIPIFQCFFITFSILGGAIYFQELSSFSVMQWVVFLLAVAAIMVGIHLLSNREMEAANTGSAADDGAEGGAKTGRAKRNSMEDLPSVKLAQSYRRSSLTSDSIDSVSSTSSTSSTRSSSIDVSSTTRRLSFGSGSSSSGSSMASRDSSGVLDGGMRSGGQQWGQAGQGLNESSDAFGDSFGDSVQGGADAGSLARKRSSAGYVQDMTAEELAEHVSRGDSVRIMV